MSKKQVVFDGYNEAEVYQIGLAALRGLKEERQLPNTDAGAEELERDEEESMIAFNVRQAIHNIECQRKVE